MKGGYIIPGKKAARGKNLSSYERKKRANTRRASKLVKKLQSSNRGSIKDRIRTRRRQSRRI